MKIKPWETLSIDEQNLYLTLLWEDGYSEKSIAEFFSTTKGRIVRRRQTTLKLPTAGRPQRKGMVNPERFVDLLDLHAMKELEARGVTPIAPPQQAAKMESSAQKCAWPLSSYKKSKPVMCGKQAVEGHRLCKEHLRMVQSLI